MNDFIAGWYLIYTKPRHEKKITARLNEMSIDSLLPTRKRLRTWHDRKKYIDEPLFPSYVFVYLHNVQSYYGGMDIDGALYYVRSGKQAARVNESVINNIRLATGEGHEIEVLDDHFKPGQQLVIRQGILTGLTGELVQLNGKRKLLIRVDLLQRSILMTLPPEDLMVIK